MIPIPRNTGVLAVWPGARRWHPLQVPRQADRSPAPPVHKPARVHHGGRTRATEGHGGTRINRGLPRPPVSAPPGRRTAPGLAVLAAAARPAHAACPAIPPFSVALRGPLPLLRVENWPAGLARSEPIARAGTPTLTILAATRAQDRDQAPDDWLDGCGDCDAGRSKTRHYQRHRALRTCGTLTTPSVESRTTG